MGQGMSWLTGLLWSKKEIRILILGLVRHLSSVVPPQFGVLPLCSHTYSHARLAKLCETMQSGATQQLSLTMKRSTGQCRKDDVII